MEITQPMTYLRRSRSARPSSILRSVTCAGAMGLIALGPIGCASSPRDEFYQIRAAAYSSRPGDGSVADSTWPAPKATGLGRRGTALAGADDR